MLQKAINEGRSTVRAALRATTLVIAAGVAALVALGFVCAAGFIYIRDRYGVIEACLAGAALFLVAAIVLFVCYASLRRRARRPAAVAKSTMQAALTDPMVIAAALQIVRTIGIKRLIPLLAIGGVALGLASKPQARTPRQDDMNR